MKKIFVTIPEGAVKDTFLPPAVREKLESQFAVSYDSGTGRIGKEALIAALRDKDAVLTGWGAPMLNREVLAQAKQLKLIVHTGGTVGNLIDDFPYEAGITVLSGNRLYAESVAEGTLAYMLTALRRIPDYIESVRGGRWRTEADLWEGLLDKTVGIIGLGTISTILIRLLQSFRVSIKVFSHYPMDEAFLREHHCTAASLENVCSTCDVVSVHSALNAENRGLLQKRHFEMLRDGCLFLNTARGDVLDEAALIEELKKGRFRAVLDVYHQEPPPQDSPLRSLKNVYCVPHMAGPTLDRRPRITLALIQEMCDFFDGRRDLKLEITRETAARMTKM